MAFGSWFKKVNKNDDVRKWHIEPKPYVQINRNFDHSIIDKPIPEEIRERVKHVNNLFIKPVNAEIK